MWRVACALWKNSDGAVAPTVALSLIGLVAIGGVAFDYAHLAAMDTELQQAADQAALAAATQLDGQSGAIARATAAAQNLITNRTLLAGDGTSNAVTVPTITFCSAFDDSQANTTNACTTTTSDGSAKVVWVKVGGRTANFALTPIVGLFSQSIQGAEAVAALNSAICKTPPTMLCNPAEPTGNTNQNLGFTPTPGVGLNLITGQAGVPGNFGWLEASNGPGASNLAELLAYNTPPASCQPADQVTTKPGLTNSVFNAFNTRFDVYANGNQTCPNQCGGTCSPSDVTMKDLVCGTTGNGTPSSCANNASWAEASKPYRLQNNTIQDLSGAPGTDPTIMGYPPDECHMSSTATGACGVVGDGNWDRNAYFRVNYGWTASQWPSKTGLSTSATRYQVYKWERANISKDGKGISIPQQDATTKNYAFGQPATGTPGVAPSSTQADRRVIAVAVLNCQAYGLTGSKTVPVAAWMDVFLVQPAMNRPGTPISGTNVYVEEIGTTTRSGDLSNATVLRRDRPYLIR